jgi:hypothetical protein
VTDSSVTKLDIVERLLAYYTEDAERFCITHSICDEAAAEINRLREEVRYLRGRTGICRLAMKPKKLRFTSR